MSRKKTDSFILLEFAKRLSELVPNKERKEFSKRVGVSYETIRVWCKGKNFPEGSTLLKLFSVLQEQNKSINWLLTGNKAKHKNTHKFTREEMNPRPLNVLSMINGVNSIEDKGLKHHLAVLIADIELGSFGSAKQRAKLIIEELEKIEEKQEK